MTAKEKFLELVSKEKSNTLEKIRNRRQEKMDEYAIEFTQWVLDKFTFKDYIHKELSELLEIFKKEKGL